MAYFRAVLFAFALAVIALALMHWLTGDRRYLRWTGRLFAIALGAGVIFFTVLLIQRFT
jgi:hypothetical protein